MTLLTLLKKESVVPHRNILVMAFISGLANVAILALINTAAGRSPQTDAGTRLLLLFLVAMAVFNISQRYMFNKTAVVFETMVDGLRTRILDKIRTSDLVTLERMGHAEVYTKLTHNTTVISQTAGMMAAAIQSALMVTFSILYISFLSMPAFFITVGTIVIGCFVYLNSEKKIIGYIHSANRTEVDFFNGVTNILKGFKESKMSARRSGALSRHTKNVSEETKNLKITASQMYSRNYVFAQNFFYILIAVVIFLLPQLVPTYAESVTEVAATILFIIGPLSTVVSGVPAYTNADIAVKEIYQLEESLDGAGSSVPIDEEAEPMTQKFERLEVRNLEFSYRDPAGAAMFSIGPVDFDLKAGETVFIVGGNGSGKSTFIKALLGLYTPDRGTIAVNGENVDIYNLQGYREMFSTILSDFHLFDRLYGMRDVDEGKVNELIRQMGLEKKTKYINGRFGNLELSTGQRKRLAMIVAILEDRPICVFDEWAAEQDPEFRQYFYETLLKELKSRGKGVIAISHDDRYFDMADRVIKMDYGRMVPA